LVIKNRVCTSFSQNNNLQIKEIFSSKRYYFSDSKGKFGSHVPRKNRIKLVSVRRHLQGNLGGALHRKWKCLCHRHVM